MPSEELPSPNPSPEEWLADQLRRVPLPAGLLQRLRGLALAGDQQLDAALRDVPLPPGLEARLGGPAGWSDAQLDRRLADVPAHPALTDTLRAIPTYADPHLEAMLRQVPPPPRLLEGLAAIGCPTVQPATVVWKWRQRVRRRRWWWQLATAASVVLTISLAYLLAIGGLLVTAYRRSPPDQLALALRQPGGLWEGEISERPAIDLAAPAPAELVPHQPSETPLTRWEDLQQIEPLAATIDFARDLHRRWEEAVAELGNRMIEERAVEPLAPLAHPVQDRLSAVQQVEDIRPRGIAPPLLDPALILFQITRGAHPFQDPAVGRPLETCTVPLITETASYEWATQLVDRAAQVAAPDRRSLEASLARRVRTEEFLAAIDYPLPSPAEGRVEIRTFGGPSPWGAAGDQMLLVVVMAGPEAQGVAAPDRPIARAAELTVKFVPQSVAAYRLLGHEAVSTVGLLDGPFEFDLQPGQTCVGLFELRFRAAGGERIGRVTLSWYDRDHQRQQLRLPVGRQEFAPTFEDSAGPLQAAVLMAETAELFRRSPFVDRPASSLQAVRQMADRADPALRGTPSFQDYLKFLETALRAGLR